LKKIKFQDTTLRDGEQTPGIAFNFDDKLSLTKIICELGIDSMELGFPAVSSEESDTIKKISKEVINENITFCVFSRALKSDIKVSYESIKLLKNTKIQIVAPSSDLHILHSTSESKKSIIKNVKDSIRYAKVFFENIQFTAQDAPRADRQYLEDLIGVAINNGASTICLPDTIGCCLPNEYQSLIRYVKKIIKPFNNIKIAAHCHNDLGLATANTIAAIDAGVDQVECTLNGIGERAGNTPLEEVAAILDLKNPEKISKNLNLKFIKSASSELEKITKIKIHSNKPVLGRNVFMHASGMHQRAVIENIKTFEILDASKFGFKGGKIALGKVSGRAGVESLLKEAGIKLAKSDLNNFMIYLKNRALDDKKFYDQNIKIFIKGFYKENK